jgi:SHS2 domain-containing protein
MNSKIDVMTASRLEELRKYEEITEMTEDERTALREWVAEGNSVHENGSMGYHENGEPLDFLDVYRYEEEIRRELKNLTPKEQENYIARLQGRDTLDTLREDMTELLFKIDAYRRILQKHGLLSEAETLMKTWQANSINLPPIDIDDLPFQ